MSRFFHPLRCLNCLPLGSSTAWTPANQSGTPETRSVRCTLEAPGKKPPARVCYWKRRQRTSAGCRSRTNHVPVRKSICLEGHSREQISVEMTRFACRDIYGWKQLDYRNFDGFNRHDVPRILI
jgi:hypothetical protein